MGLSGLVQTQELTQFFPSRQITSVTSSAAEPRGQTRKNTYCSTAVVPQTHFFWVWYWAAQKEYLHFYVLF